MVIDSKMKALNTQIEKAIHKLQVYLNGAQLTSLQIQSLAKLSEELNSDRALESIRLDPYWPKWDSPWWKMLLLYESGNKQLILKAFLDELVKVLDAHYLHWFPLTEAELPEGCDGYRNIMCHCALGSIYKVLEDCGFEVRTLLPWCYEWLGRYQLPDGGYNCEEGAYTKSRKSSFLSTLPMLEAMLIVYKKTKDSPIKGLLDKGAEYLLKHSIYKSSSGKLIDADWLQLSFPRYYDYDVLRGFSFVVDWAHETGYALPVSLVEDCFLQISEQTNADGCIVVRADKLAREGSLFYSAKQWNWEDKSLSYPALDMFNSGGDVSLPLSKVWLKTLNKLFKIVSEDG